MLTVRRRLGVVSASAAIALLAAGCGESKVSQCNRLAEIVNQAQGFMPAFESNIQTFSANAAQVKSLDDIKAAADQYVQAVNGVVSDLDALGTELENTDLSDEQLISYRDRYIEMVQGFSTALTQASSAMSVVQEVETEADLPAKIEESQQQTVQAVQQIQELSVEESTIINEVNTYCGAEGSEPAPAAPEDGEAAPEGEVAPEGEATPEGSE
jgi:ABC-type transporter Mla subunit MlaD